MADRSAIFVDAGYLFAAGSTLLAGSKQPRHQIDFDAKAAVAALKEFLVTKVGNTLLRVYWYDGVTAKGLTSDHERIAASNDIKLRLGLINSVGEQKGVDSLIVTDLVELARNGAMCDAILLAGDEDIRIGVQIAQSYGVRVHLLGIERARANQSKPLIHEADTTHEWSADVVRSFLSIRPGVTLSTKSAPLPSPVQITPQSVVFPVVGEPDTAPSVARCAEDFAAALESSDVFTIADHWMDYRMLPKTFDGRLLASTGQRLGRDLTPKERVEMRETFLESVRKRHPTGF